MFDLRATHYARSEGDWVLCLRAVEQSEPARHRIWWTAEPEGVDCGECGRLIALIRDLAPGLRTPDRAVSEISKNIERAIGASLTDVRKARKSIEEFVAIERSGGDEP